ncbi:helix-turn-helix transcriptional regulator [Candidatus Kaiserbacteria bacterium]|nr:helix-turn-helix transcriptional regulator [Candidatus Kaiserbacteria bacterium]
MALRTATQRRELCRDCPIARVADALGDPCSLLIIRDLIDEPRRFSELEESLGMSTRTLTLTLRRLQKQGIVSRHERKTLPLYVQYRITRKGAAFGAVVDAMRSYGKKYL